MSGDLNSGVNQFMIKADTSGGLGAGKGVIVRFFKGSDTLSRGLFWMSDSNWVPQDEWNYTDAYGNPLGPNNFSIRTPCGAAALMGRRGPSLWSPESSSRNPGSGLGRGRMALSGISEVRRVAAGLLLLFRRHPGPHEPLRRLQTRFLSTSNC